MAVVSFAASSGVCFLIDYGIFTLLNAVVLLGLPDGGRELAAAAGAQVLVAGSDVFKAADRKARIARLRGETE